MTTYILHILDVLCRFQSYVCKKILISSTSHTVHTVHTHKVGLMSFDIKWWLCEDVIHSYSHGHKDTVSDTVDLFVKYYIVDSFTNMGTYSCNNLPGTTPLDDSLI